MGDDSDDQDLEELQPTGTFETLLLPVNSKISKNISGEVQISKDGDFLEVIVKVKNGPKKYLKQAISLGSECPRPGSDTNSDGLIDELEAQPFSGKIAVPLDSDLSSQESGSEITFTGSYKYQRTTSYIMMLSDLRSIDENPQDEFGKISGNEFDFEGKVVSVYLAQEKHMVACGVLVKTSDSTLPPTETYDPPNPPRVPIPRTPFPRPTPTPPEPHRPAPSDNDWWGDLENEWHDWRNRVRDWWNRRRH